MQVSGNGINLTIGGARAGLPAEKRRWPNNLSGADLDALFEGLMADRAADWQGGLRAMVGAGLLIQAEIQPNTQGEKGDDN